VYTETDIYTRDGGLHTYITQTDTLTSIRITHIHAPKEERGKGGTRLGCDRTEYVIACKGCQTHRNAGCDEFRLQSPVAFTFASNKVQECNSSGAGVLPVGGISRSRRSTLKSSRNLLAVDYEPLSSSGYHWSTLWVNQGQLSRRWDGDGEEYRARTHKH